MMTIESENASQAIEKKSTIKNMNRLTVIFATLFIGLAITFIVAYFAPDYWLLGTIIGILLGSGFGIYLSSLINFFIEGIMQVLAIQGETVDKLRKLQAYVERNIGRNIST